MIGRVEQLFGYSLVEDFITVPPNGVAFYLSKFNISFAILVFVYLIVRRKFDWWHLAILAALAIPFSLSDQLLFETFTPNANNPQVPHFFLILLSAGILFCMALYRRTRTRSRIFGAIIGFATIGAFVLIHAATINIKLKEQSNMQESSHLAVFDATMMRDDQLTFLDYCNAERIKCYTELPNETQRKEIYALLGNQAESTFNEIDKGANYRYVKAFSFDTQAEHGAFLFMYGKMNGMIRILIDQDNINKLHLSVLKVMYSWFAIVSSFWIYGGLYLLWWHDRGRRKPR